MAEEGAPINAIAEHEFAYVATVGRRTGRPHVIEIWYVHHGGAFYLMSGGRDRSDWVRNIVANPTVILRLGGPRTLTPEGGRPAVARLVQAGTDEDALARRMMVTKYQTASEDLTGWSQTALVVAVSPLARR